MDNSLISLDVKQSDAFVLCEVMRVKIESIISNQQALLSAIFDSRYKLLLASYGIKKKLFGGWQEGVPYTEDVSISSAMHDEEANYISFVTAYRTASSLCNIFNGLIVKADYSSEQKHLAKFEELFASHWATIAKKMSFHGHTKTPNDWAAFYETIYSKWFSAHQAFKKKHFGY